MIGIQKLRSFLCILWIFLPFVVVYSQNQLNDVCDLNNGQKGKCLHFKECPSAIVLIRNQGKPNHCGFDGIEPIICCEISQPLVSLKVGDRSKQKCKETYSGLKTISSSKPSRPILLNLASENTSSKVRRQTVENSTGTNETFPVLSIVGGMDSREEEYVHMAALGYGEWPNVKWACGGSLISEKFVLSAAHCIQSREIGRVKYVRLGDLDLKSTTDYASPQDFNISRIIKHPDYKAPSVYNDIALIELETTAYFNNFVHPACLHTERDITDSIWIATGWGVTSFGGESADHLQQVMLREFSFEDCQMAYNTTSSRKLNKGIDNNSQLCAGEVEKDTCQGDSGGPLQIKNLDYARGYTVIGVTSFGKACGIATSPAVYTRVSYFIEWIESIVWPN